MCCHTPGGFNGVEGVRNGGLKSGQRFGEALARSSSEHAGVLVGGWRAVYNVCRPHSSLSYQTPHEFAAGWLVQWASQPVPYT
ncbi:integrase core domain-containing protein [Deinococcus sp. QL22]|uniref:integrase core domain-containing protein n=1 Tax=Deinococcus sp. QL22 TaxID=2939437 RepID=UPI00352FF06F